MSRSPLSLFAPFAAGLLLVACSAAPDSEAAQTTPQPGTGLIGVPLDAPPAEDTAQDNVGDADADMGDDIDTDDYDPAEHLRQQLARQPAARGSGGPVQACMLSGRIELLGVSEDVRDCMQSNSTYSVAEFQKACEGLAHALTSSGNAPAKIDYLSACPTPSQGSCRNFMNTGMDAFYYQRTELASLPGSCSGAGGTWRAGS